MLLIHWVPSNILSTTINVSSVTGMLITVVSKHSKVVCASRQDYLQRYLAEKPELAFVLKTMSNTAKKITKM